MPIAWLTKSGRVWRKVQESDAWSVHAYMTVFCVSCDLPLPLSVLNGCESESVESECACKVYLIYCVI